MMSEKVKDNPSINETELKSFSEIIKDKIFNKVFAYVVISFLIFNWKGYFNYIKVKGRHPIYIIYCFCWW